MKTACGNMLSSTCHDLQAIWLDNPFPQTLCLGLTFPTRRKLTDHRGPP